eukprot:scaffold2322_cov135-Cylindrotheca_fusiformis.AAC.20
MSVCIALRDRHFPVSGGCSGAIERILNKVDGVSKVETNVDAKSVVVDHDASVTPEFLLEKLMKWSKATVGQEIGTLLGVEGLVYSQSWTPLLSVATHVEDVLRTDSGHFQAYHCAVQCAVVLATQNRQTQTARRVGDGLCKVRYRQRQKEDVGHHCPTLLLWRLPNKAAVENMSFQPPPPPNNQFRPPPAPGGGGFAPPPPGGPKPGAGFAPPPPNAGPRPGGGFAPPPPAPGGMNQLNKGMGNMSFQPPPPGAGAPRPGGPAPPGSFAGGAQP